MVNFAGKFERSYLNRFVGYVESVMNEVGVEVVVSGGLIEDQERLRRLVDKVRTRLENPATRQRTRPYLLLKLIATLSRYFRSSITETAIRKHLSFDSL